MGDSGDDEQMGDLRDLASLLTGIAEGLKHYGIECVILARSLMTNETKLVVALAKDGPFADRQQEIIKTILESIGGQVSSVDGITFTAPTPKGSA